MENLVPIIIVEMYEHLLQKEVMPKNFYKSFKWDG